MSEKSAEWLSIVKKGGVVWLDGIQKRKPPKWTKRIPDSFSGFVRITPTTVTTYDEDWRMLGAFGKDTK